MRRSLFLTLAIAIGCDPPPPLVGDDGLQPLPPLDNAPTTLERTVVPVNPFTPSDDNPSLPDVLVPLLDSDLGDLEVGDGEPIIARTLDDTPAPDRGANVRRLARFVHLADIQLMDDESPTRAAAFDSPQINSALRPNDPVMCRMLNATVRTINALHAEDAIDFVLLGGDNADSAQTNETQWVMSILNGSAEVHCDSGNDDDMDPNDDNDGKDRFASAGLDMPWLWVSGNHDVTVQGNFTPDDTQKANALGTVAQLGTREYALGGFGAVLTGDVVVADATRALLDGAALLTLVGGDEDGHGLAPHAEDATLNASGKSFYSFDAGELTFVIIDTSHARGGSSGVLQRQHVDAFVRPALDDALARGRPVIIASHHAAGSLTVDGGQFGTEEPDAILQDEWLAFLADYPNVLFSMVAHSHQHRVRIKDTGAHAYWEVATSALSDFPHQFRIVEVFDDDNGTLRLETYAVDYFADDDPPALLGRSLGLIDILSAWNDDGRGVVNERNVALIAPLP